MCHPILVEGPYPDSPTKEPENYPASVLGSLLDDLRNQLSRPPGSIWPQPKNDPQNFPLESSRLTPGLNKEEQATRCAPREPGHPLSYSIAVFPILADVVEVKKGSRSTAHWSNDFIRLNRWLRNSFAQLITPLDIDSIGQNWEDSNSNKLDGRAPFPCGANVKLSSVQPICLDCRLYEPMGIFGLTHARMPVVMDGTRRDAD